MTATLEIAQSGPNKGKFVATHLRPPDGHGHQLQQRGLRDRAAARVRERPQADLLLLEHLATLTRDRIRYHDTDIEFDKLTDPTPTQRRAFDLINATIPLTIAS